VCLGRTDKVAQRKGREDVKNGKGKFLRRATSTGAHRGVGGVHVQMGGEGGEKVGVMGRPFG